VAADDRKLVRRCLAGDSDAIRALVECYQGPVYGFCYRIVRHRHDAEDITQEVMLRAIRHLGHWDGQRPLRPWILAIAANRCRTHLARQSRRPVPTEHVAEIADERKPEHDRDLVGELELALAGLRPEYRMVVTMFHEQELAYEEISSAIGRPIGTVKTWLHRARAELARRLVRQAGMRDLCRQVD
jgi:RNA polymerase sigma-70 factor (ECF subfamily)